MSKRQSVVFGDWSKGDYGPGDPTQPGTFRGIDLMLYEDGSVGPRPAMLPLSNPVTGYATTDLTNVHLSEPDFFVAGVRHIVTVDSGGVIRGVPELGGTSVSPGTSTTQINGIAAFNGKVYAVRETGGGIRFNSTTITAVAALPNGSFIAAYNDQLVVAKYSAPNNLIQWSAPSDGDTWPAANFLRVGSGSSIKAIIPQRNSLAILLYNGEWWVITGPLGPSAILRKVDILAPPDQLQPRGPSGAIQSALTISNDGTVWWLDTRRLNFFTGAQANSLLRVDDPYHVSDVWYGDSPSPPYPLTGAPLLGDQEVAFSGIIQQSLASTISRGTIVANRNGAWSRWIMPPAFVDMGSGVACVVSNGSGILFVVHQASATAPTFYRMNTLARSPLYSGFNGASQSGGVGGQIFYTVPLDGNTGLPVTATLRTHTWLHPEMLDVHVKAVLVDLQYDASDSYNLANTQFSLAVEAVNPNTRTDFLSSGSQLWTPVGSPKTSTTASNINIQRAVFRFGDQGSGPGFRLAFTGMRGCTIRRATAVVDVNDGMMF